MWKDYDLNNPASWTVMEAPTVDPSWEEALTRIGGLSPFGQPNLVWRWGATYRDPMSLDNGLKYWLANTEPTCRGYYYRDDDGQIVKVPFGQLDQVPAKKVALPLYEHDELGERRIIIEQWRSAEFLARSGRYQPNTVRDPDLVKDFYLCRVCDTELTLTPQGLPPCPNCGSGRHYVRSIREKGEGQLLRTLPEEGCYDCFVRLENTDGEPMPPDAHALKLIEQLWHDQHTKTQKEKLTEMVEAVAPQEALRRAATNPANPFLPPTVPGG